MAVRELPTATIEALMRVAARCSVIPHEAEDLMQDVLLSAIEKNRDCGDPSFLRWATGAIRNSARFAARTAARRKRRERAYVVEHERPAHSLPRFPDSFIATLPRSRRVVALLINLGMGRREIAYLLGLSDMAMRQRIAGVRKAFADFAGEAESDPRASFPADGLARRALKASLPNGRERRFAVRDPDGLPIFFQRAVTFQVSAATERERTAKGAPEECGSDSTASPLSSRSPTSTARKGSTATISASSSSASRARRKGRS
jgi:DNA-directed RNA polymerase specialized sigma24 family protein